jgi:chemotaxis protein methyltransferase CheR
MIQLQPAERSVVAQYVYAVSGIALDSSKDYLIEGRLSAVAEDAGCPTLSALVARAKADPTRAMERRIIDAITTNETSFFRDSAPFDLLRHKIVPDLIDRRQHGGSCRVRIWSAACSTGQELYSVAMLLKDTLGDVDRYGVRLFGTDISDAVVARASKGVFNDTEIARGLSPEMRARHFIRHGGAWQIGDEIRSMASFRRMNLLGDLGGLGKFDIILCRNVAIYFSEADRQTLFGRLGRQMESDGYLLVGSMESLMSMRQFESKRHLRAVYYQLKPHTA